ncbi:MAG TPA: MarR family transcriptional regulator [Streptosporangiaceae bacterium]|jgi:DNA-binding MarR family transcriptional regulator
MSPDKSRLSASLSGPGEVLLGPLVRDAFRWYQDAVVAYLKAHGQPALSLAQFEVFGHIDREGTSVSELARRLRIARQSAHQTVRELAAAGLVTVGPHPEFARRTLVRPTPEATARLERVRAGLAGIERQLAERLGSGRVEQLRSLLGADWGDPAKAAELD